MKTKKPKLPPNTAEHLARCKKDFKYWWEKTKRNEERRDWEALRRKELGLEPVKPMAKWTLKRAKAHWSEYVENTTSHGNKKVKGRFYSIK